MTTPLTDHWRKAFDNLYLGAWNLYVPGKGYTTTTVTIERIVRESVTMQGGRKSVETLVYFRGKRTPLILTRKMGKVLAAMHGPIPQEWIGKTIGLYVEQGFKAKDGPADVLRIKNARAGDSLKRELAGEEAPPPEQFGSDDEEPREPGQEG